MFRETLDGSPSDTAGMLARIAGDRRRGAADVAMSLLDWAVVWSGAEGDDDPTASPRRVLEGLATVGRVQAAMAPVLRIANDLVVALEPLADDDGAGCRTVVRAVAMRWRERLEAASGTLVLHLRRALGSAPTIYTYSASSTITRALVAHCEAGNWFKVVCSEARPGGEGTALARELAERGVPVKLGTDVWLAGAIDDDGLFVCGADALLPDRWVNKIGTALIARRAADHGVPVICASDTSKWLPPALAALPRSYDRDPGEIAFQAPALLEVVNPYFEEIRYDALSQLITERGPTRPRDLRAGDVTIAGAFR